MGGSGAGGSHAELVGACWSTVNLDVLNSAAVVGLTGWLTKMTAINCVTRGEGETGEVCTFTRQV